MSLTFPTRPTGLHPPGVPKRASHCRCIGGPMFDPASGRCVRCGHDPKAAIAETWQERRERIKASRARRAKAA